MSFLINPFTFAVAGGDFESIATVTVGSGGAASMEFTSIPSTYQHLQIRVLAGDTWTGSNWSYSSITFNGSSSSYALHSLYGTGSVAGAEALTSVSAGRFYSGNNVQLGAAVVDILDYTSTSKNKTVRQLAGVDVNGGGIITVGSSLWFATPASVTSITLTAGNGSYRQHTTAALYGVKAP